mgnify:CR=1 FL=1
MKTRKPPRLVTTENLSSYFRSRGIAFKEMGSLRLGFGRGRDQFCLYNYPAPADDETMGVFCEWHTEDYFEVLGVRTARGRSFTPDDFRQGSTVKIIYLHVPSALMAINAWLMMLVASLIWLVRRHHVSALAARAGPAGSDTPGAPDRPGQLPRCGD